MGGDGAGAGRMEHASGEAHAAWLAAQAALPLGFRVGAASFDFVPVEVNKPSRMTLTLLALDRPTDAFAAMFTRNAFPGAPVLVGRSRLGSPALSAVIVNNKISNVCAPSGVESSERVAAAVAAALSVPADAVLPCSTGVIGWRLPVDAMLAAVPTAVAALQPSSVLPAAQGIVTTDLYPKIRRASVPGGGVIVGIAKGAGMIEPNLATMLVYLLTDCDVGRDELREALRDAVHPTFNALSIDTDTSTSDTVAVLSSRRVPCDLEAFRAALGQVCAALAEDVVRNGEGVHHVVRVVVTGAPSARLARGVGKAIVGSPLVQCAIAGNDPNVGRLVMAIGKYVGAEASEAGSGEPLDLSRCTITMAGHTIFAEGTFRLDPTTERALVAHLREAELYASVPPSDGLTFVPAVRYPPHERRVEIAVDLGAGEASATVLGSDRTHEYISENADYRS
ncbi:MAG TPA: bifunctional ornithine acetyltransferase/N-acetylglutamate synthase [Polyangiaceae bacterium]|nr:bifunctional ornithine acetyltransferase/N-acetylglutamate synthase [Polyangiaceae bacterium]